MFDIKITGAKEVQDMLKNLEKKIKGLEGEKTIALSELMTSDFITKYTGHVTFEDFVNKSGLLHNKTEMTEEILNSDEFNGYIKKNTRFLSWKNMLDVAVKEYIQRQLKF